MNYARVLMNRAHIYNSLAELIDVDQRNCLHKSVECLTESLLYRTANLVPLEYSLTPTQLGQHLASVVTPRRRTSPRLADQSSCGWK